MDAYEYSEMLKSLNIKMDNITHIVKPDNLNTRLKEIEELQQDSNFWNDSSNVAKIGQEKTRTQRVLAKYNNAFNALKDGVEYFELAKAEKDEDTLEMLYDDANNLETAIHTLEVEMMLSGKQDSSNAIVTIHPGAGGTESQDWASMLYRMYLRWAERHDFKVEELDYQAGEEAGIIDKY
ncbi:Peptide chain release factor 2 (RF-2) [sediment metagenome]|uniref:Peptide chain release factor 2 (RF-2) n=1 Tax=sediment metagenome TaxID=749907 RepID=D9PKG5_9ZZZZ